MSEQKTVAQPKLLSKISVKTVYGKINRRELPADGSEMKVMCVYGQATKTQVGNSDNGEWLAFIGNFKAISHRTGEVFVSGKLFLPNILSSLVHGALADTNGSVNFAFDVMVREDADSAVGYVYGGAHLMKPAENDPIEMLEREMAGTLKLEAPVEIPAEVEKAVIEHAESEKETKPTGKGSKK